MKNLAIFLFSILTITSYSINKSINDADIKEAKKTIFVSDFGAIGNDLLDDYTAIQNAINSAAITGAMVQLPAQTFNVSNTLIIPAGVTLLGEGKGSTSTATPSTGTIIKNTSNFQTIRIIGHNAGVRDIVIYDSDNSGALGGIEILADAKMIESITINNVLISGFTSGTALSLITQNGGGIAYCSFYDLRIRHAKTGILINEIDAASFINSNSFYHGAISGGGFDYGLRVKGGNNNIFNALVIEPYTSVFGHIVVEDGEIQGREIRVEGTQQPNNIPLIHFFENTRNSVINGMYSGGLTINKGDNYIDLKSGKFIGYKNFETNLFMNPGFTGVSGNSVPYWEVYGSDIQMSVLPAVFLPGYNVLKITIPPGTETYLRPAIGFAPSVLESNKYDIVNFGAYVKTDRANTVATLCKAPLGVTTGGFHKGDSSWQFIGMTSFVDRVNFYNPKFYINNQGNTLPLDVYITTPTINFGNSTNVLEAAPLTTLGGVLTGTLTNGMLTVNTNTTGYLVFSKEGNLFEINGIDTIKRINYLASDKFLKGTVITLLFNNSNVSVTNSAYIKLLKNFTSIQNASLTLVSLGDGTWREISRNN